MNQCQPRYVQVPHVSLWRQRERCNPLIPYPPPIRHNIDLTTSLSPLSLSLSLSLSLFLCVCVCINLKIFREKGRKALNILSFSYSNFCVFLEPSHSISRLAVASSAWKCESGPRLGKNSRQRQLEEGEAFSVFSFLAGPSCRFCCAVLSVL